nr:(d)CMP kinase [Pseudonocardia spinosispora]
MGVELLRGVVALDGPSGTGKSTVAKRLARDFGARYLDTGSMYRAATLAVLRAGVEPESSAGADIAVAAAVQAGTDPGNPTICLDGENVAAEIRGLPVTSAVSAVSAHPVVRHALVELQRRIIAEVLADETRAGIVVEGRDIGTVVTPDAPLKVYLTASDEIRASRRSGQDRRAGRGGDHASTLLAVQRRDALDSGRATSPLRPAEDAVMLDTSELDIGGVLAALRELVRDRGLSWSRGPGMVR